ncbi:MAG: hypothetical protein RMK57_03140 [Bryobacterales bacterium]|nr:hypothetical protein [Bryobacterales bacterium]
MRHGRIVRALAAVLLWPQAALPQPWVTLEEAGARRARGDLPALYQREVRVRGTVSAKCIPIIDYSHLAIQDERAGFVLEGALHSFRGFEPGMVVEARGVITHRAGLPVLRVAEIRALGRQPAPAPKPVFIAELPSDRYLGLYVVTEGVVRAVGVNRGGHFLEIEAPEHPVLSVFLPHRVAGGGGLSRIRRGDRVRVTGIAHQYCPLPPYDRDYQLLIGAAAAVQVIRKAWPIPAEMIGGFLAALALASASWVFNERRVRARRRAIRRLYALGEEMTAPAPPAEKLRRLQDSIPESLDVSEVRLYVWDGDAGLLRRVGGAGEEAFAVNVDAGGGFRAAALALCFAGRAVLEVPDVRQSPFLGSDDPRELPLSALFLPMFAQRDLIGVLEINCRRARRFPSDEQAVLQHLANQTAIGMKLLEQQTSREQAYRTERLAATGQLAGTLVRELKAPLEMIAILSEAAQADEALARETARTIAATAKEAAGMLERLLPLTGSDSGDTTDVAALLRELVPGLQADWSQHGIRAEVQLPPGAVAVAVPHGVLRAVLSSLLRRAGASAGPVWVRLTELAGKVLLEIGPPSEGEEGAAETADERPLSVALCRSILENYSGVLRVAGDGEARGWEIELPGLSASSDILCESVAAPKGRPLTALVVDPDSESRQAMVALLGEAGHRAVPAATADEGAALAERFRFQVLVCSASLSGVGWLELVERTRKSIGAFVLLAEHAGPDLEAAVRARGGALLIKPVHAAALARALADLPLPRSSEDD